MSINAVRLPKFEPGTDEWMSRMSASKVSAVLGLSPWESRFSLWHRMAGLIPNSPETDTTNRGHYLEDGVARWWNDQHPDRGLRPGGAWAHPERPWQAASPDRLVYRQCPSCACDMPGPDEDCPDPCDCHDPSTPAEVVSLLEIKTALYGDEWGPSGTDQIPPYYRAQVVWQMDTLGIHTCHVAALLMSSGKFDKWTVTYNADEADYIRAECKAFMDSLPGGPAEQRPDVDAHSETYQVLRKLNPSIDGDVHVPDDLAQRYIASVTAAKAAKAIELMAYSELADLMGNARRALWLGKSIATRQQRNGGTPYLVAARKFPTLTEETDAA